jgi:hypothetical protein
MADSKAFEWLCGELASCTELSAIEARGTVRIALKKGGLSADSVTPAQLQVIVKRVLPDELRRRGSEDGQSICDQISIRLKDAGFSETGGASDSPEAVFARLGSNG